MDRGCEARVCSCVGPVSGGPTGVRPICARVWSRSLVDCGVGPVSAKGHQCVTGEIVGISPTLVVGGELNQLKSGGSHSPLGLAFGV